MERETKNIKYYIKLIPDIEGSQGSAIPFFQGNKKLYTKEEIEKDKTRWGTYEGDKEEVEVEPEKLKNNKNLYILAAGWPGSWGEGILDKKLYTKEELEEMEKNEDPKWEEATSFWEYKTPEREKEIKEQLEKMEAKLRETKTVVTHFGDDLDNKASIYYLEQWARAKGILEENENLIVERVPAGKVKEGLLNVDTGGHTGSRIDGDTIVIDGDPANGIHSAAAELADMEIETGNSALKMPKQIIELADTVPNKVSPLESRTALSLIRNTTGEQIFKIAKLGLLDKALTDEQLKKYGLVEAQKNQQAIIDNAVEKVNKYMVELENGEKVVIAPEQILAGAQIAYELGANYYGSVQAHKSGKGSTFAVTSKPGIKLPEQIREFGQDLVEEYKEKDGTSGVFLNPNGQMLVAGGFKNPDFSVEYTPEELIEELKKKFKDYELTQEESLMDINDEDERSVLLRSKMEESKDLDEKIEQAQDLLSEYQKQDPEQKKEGEAIGVN